MSGPIRLAAGRAFRTRADQSVCDCGSPGLVGFSRFIRWTGETVTTGTTANELIGALSVGCGRPGCGGRVPRAAHRLVVWVITLAPCRVPAAPPTQAPARSWCYFPVRAGSLRASCRVSLRLPGVRVLCAAQVSTGRRFHTAPYRRRAARGPTLSRTDMEEEVGGKGTQSGGDQRTGTTRRRWLSRRFFFVSALLTNRKLDRNSHHQLRDRS